MEKNQHDQHPESTSSSHENPISGETPGQQLPVNSDALAREKDQHPATKQEHSESSFPQEEGETLGTP